MTRLKEEKVLFPRAHCQLNLLSPLRFFVHRRSRKRQRERLPRVINVRRSLSLFKRFLFMNKLAKIKMQPCGRKLFVKTFFFFNIYPIQTFSNILTPLLGSILSKVFALCTLEKIEQKVEGEKNYLDLNVFCGISPRRYFHYCSAFYFFLYKQLVVPAGFAPQHT